MKKIIFILLMTVLFAGCGKKGALLPPEALLPAPVADLRVEQQGGQLLVSWSRPSRLQGGGALRDLAGFRLFRRQVLPQGQDCEECQSAYQLLATVDVEYPREVVIMGDRYFLLDGGVVQGTTYRYKVVSFNKNEAPSKTSNLATAKMVLPPFPPVVKAVSLPTGIQLTWSPPQSPHEGRLTGYNVYRSRNGEPLPPVPLTGAPVKETVFEDTRIEHGVTYKYAVRSVAVVAGEPVESELSGEVGGAVAEPE